MPYWLVKTEPDECSFLDLQNAQGQTLPWDGVRNYQARNYLKQMRLGERVFVYHSSTAKRGIAGIARVVREAYPDPAQFDPTSSYFDARAAKMPRDKAPWIAIDLQAEIPLCFISLETLRLDVKLEGLFLLRRGSRLSVGPVADAHWHHILNLGGTS